MVNSHTNYRPEGHDDAELIEWLEPDQISATAAKPFPRFHLSKWESRGLWGLRIFVLLITAMVVYTFLMHVVRGG